MRLICVGWVSAELVVLALPLFALFLPFLATGTKSLSALARLGVTGHSVWWLLG
jgi:hypothetical protein